tara:strand:- start:866 stop:1276 length:411 start_codon:yes stop_codon:yes gene_type:complete
MYKFYKGMTLLECIIGLSVCVTIIPLIVQFLVLFNTVLLAVKDDMNSASELLFLEAVMRRDLKQAVSYKINNDFIYLTFDDKTISYFIKSNRIVRQTNTLNRYMNNYLSYEVLNRVNDHCFEIISNKSNKIFCVNE